MCAQVEQSASISSAGTPRCHDGQGCQPTANRKDLARHALHRILVGIRQLAETLAQLAAAISKPFFWQKVGGFLHGQGVSLRQKEGEDVKDGQDVCGFQFPARMWQEELAGRSRVTPAANGSSHSSHGMALGHRDVFVFRRHFVGATVSHRVEQFAAAGDHIMAQGGAVVGPVEAEDDLLVGIGQQAEGLMPCRGIGTFWAMAKAGALSRMETRGLLGWLSLLAVEVTSPVQVALCTIRAIALGAPRPCPP